METFTKVLFWIGIVFSVYSGIICISEEFTGGSKGGSNSIKDCSKLGALFLFTALVCNFIF